MTTDELSKLDAQVCRLLGMEKHKLPCGRWGSFSGIFHLREWPSPTRNDADFGEAVRLAYGHAIIQLGGDHLSAGVWWGRPSRLSMPYGESDEPDVQIAFCKAVVAAGVKR